MKTMKKALLFMLCAALVVSATVFGTLAYLTDTETVTNTFTVGKVYIDLDEAKVNPDGTYTTDHDNRVKENAYHLLPGHTYYKDPTVTVEADSEESYVRMLVTFNFSSQLDAIFAPTGAEMTSIFNGYESANWALHEVSKDETANTRTYEFRYVGEDSKGTKDGTVKKAENGAIVLDDLFDSITIPGSITNEQLATLVVKNDAGEIVDQFKITVVAHAIQADGFANADAAWAEFK